MPRSGYLTAEEYKSIRQVLGMTQQEAREFHGVQNISTIKRWENGYSRVSELACDKITDLLKKVNWTIEQALNKVREFKEGELEVVLIVYPESCYKKFAAGFADLPNSVHRAMVTRLYIALRELGIEAGVVEFNPQDYINYLGSHGLQDGQDVRSSWAADYRERLLKN